MSAPAPASAAAARALVWLRRQPRRHLLLLALVPVLVAVWMPILTGGTPPAGVAASLSPAAPADGDVSALAAPAGETSAAALAAATIEATAAFEQRVRTLTQPFRPRHAAPVAPAAPAEEPRRIDPTPPPAAELAPSAILLSRGSDPVAIVQGRAWRVGDVVAGHRIVAIEERRVVYGDGERTVIADIPSNLGSR